MCGAFGWTFSEIVLYAQRRALERLDKLSHWGAKLVAQQQGIATGEMGFRVSLHRSTPELLMSALGQKQTFCHL